jgi:hypothetical protein
MRRARARLRHTPPEQICAVIAMTCEKPSESEQRISHWSHGEIADEAIRRGLGFEHLAALGGEFLKKEADLKPHRSLPLMPNAPTSVRSTRRQPVADEGHCTVSIDELTGIQALERVAPGLPMKPGKV